VDKVFSTFLKKKIGLASVGIARYRTEHVQGSDEARSLEVILIQVKRLLPNIR
jgi:hypothetical protein